MSWSAFDNGTPTPAVPVLTSHHQLPPQQQQQQQQQPDMSAAWAAFGEDNSQPQPQPSQQAQQAQQAQQGQQQVSQQQQQRAAELALQPPKPAPRQELPLVSLPASLPPRTTTPEH